MSLYMTDGEIPFGWKSFGRSFAVIGGFALAAVALRFALRHGLGAVPLETVSQMLVWYVEWVGMVILALMAIAAWGSILISHQERARVEMTLEGLSRIFKRSRENLFPLEQISGFMVRPHGKAMLIDRTGKQNMILPHRAVGRAKILSEGVLSRQTRLCSLGAPRTKPISKESAMHFAGWHFGEIQVQIQS
jgi:hypothetical protein